MCPFQFLCLDFTIDLNLWMRASDPGNESLILSVVSILDLQISDWAPSANCRGNPGLLTRNMSYIKPLNGSIGPRQTKCELSDEVVHCDFDDFVSTLTTTRTPDVPSGNVFSVKTRTCIMWASNVSSRVIVTTQVEWSGRSFIKGEFPNGLRMLRSGGYIFLQ